MRGRKRAWGTSRKSYEGGILESYAKTARESGVSALEAPSHTLVHTIIGKITKPFHQRAQRVCLGPAHISNVFLQTMGHLCIFCLGNNKQSLGKVPAETQKWKLGSPQCTWVLFSLQQKIYEAAPTSSVVKGRNLQTCNWRGGMGQGLGEVSQVLTSITPKI